MINVICSTKLSYPRMFDQSFAGLIVTFDWRNTTPQSGSRQPGLESGHKA
jgi:hypothetical protein